MEEAQIEEPLEPGECAQDFLREVLAAMEFVADVELAGEENGVHRLNIHGDDASRVVGRQGVTLNALQYLTGLVVQKETGHHARLLVDADGYRSKREAALVKLATSLAAEVKEAGQEAELDPLTAFERRIIHNALQDDPDVMTYSEGEEPERRVIIAPRNKPE